MCIRDRGWARVALVPTDFDVAECPTIDPHRWVDRGPVTPGTGSGWREVLLDPVQEHLVEWAARMAPEAVPGARIPRQVQAGTLLKTMSDQLAPRAILAFDYCSTTPEVAARPQDEWLRTYVNHERGGPYHQAPGQQDITTEVCVDQLTDFFGAPELATQADFLADLGIEDLVAEGDAIWRERAAIGDLEALKARSRRREAEALTDPAGLGAFAVMQWRSG